MKLRWLVSMGWGVMLSVGFSPRVSAGDGAKPVLVHYLPWYAAPPISRQWGWHWTMGRFQPATVDTNGLREVAAQDCPLIDLYDSSDPDLLEYHVLLMKLAGIDGVVIDWYGTAEFRDYGQIHRNTQRLIGYLKRAGLRFVICYEDQSVKHMRADNFLHLPGDMAQGKKDLQWLDEHWLGDEAYVKIDGRPVLLVFGPQYFDGAQWKQLRSGLSLRPLLLALPHWSQPARADGAFGWPPVSGGREVGPEDWRKYIQALSARAETGEPVSSVVFPGFHDIYREAGVHDSYGHIGDQGGLTFAETFDMARKDKTPLIQIATWNDFGEGTEIEPTKTFGYRYLEIAQKFARPGLPFGANDLRLPAILFQLKKQYQHNPEAITELNKAADLLFAGKCAAARSILLRY
jgi:hypothetical protein